MKRNVKLIFGVLVFIAIVTVIILIATGVIDLSSLFGSSSTTKTPKPTTPKPTTPKPPPPQYPCKCNPDLGKPALDCLSKNQTKCASCISGSGMSPKILSKGCCIPNGYPSLYSNTHNKEPNNSCCTGYSCKGGIGPDLCCYGS